MLKLCFFVLFFSSALSWSFNLERYDRSTSYYGNLVATNGITTGLVCDDLINDRTAHYLCQAMGYTRMTYWNRWEAVTSSDRLNEATAVALDFALDDVQCTGISGVFEDDCTYSTTDNCAVKGESLILYCSNGKEFSVVSGKGRHLMGGERDGIGSVVAGVNYHGIFTGPALICAAESGYSKNILDMICRQNGYVASRGYTTHRMASDSTRANYHWADKTAGMTKVTLGIEECGANATRTSECEWGEVVVRRGDCNIDDTLVIHCTSKQFDIVWFQVLANPEGGRNGSLESYSADAGTVVATLVDLRTGETLHSLVRANSSISATVVCAQLGFGGGSYHTQREMSPDGRLSVGFIEEQGIRTVISDYKCDSSTADAMGCEFTDKIQGWDPEDAMAVECFY